MTPEEIALARARVPAAFADPWHRRALRWGLWLGLIAWIALTAWAFDITPQRIANGLGNLGVIVGLMIPPSPGEHWDEIARSMAETVAMAFLGTFVAALVAVPLGFLGAGNVVTNWLFHFSLRRLFDGFRGIDQLIWALVFVRAVGLGPLAGVMAIAVADVAVLAKLYAEAIENAERRQMEGVRAVGAKPSLVVRFGLLPQVFPVMLAQALYFVESNTRSASVLGIVGAGGIGLSIAERIRIRAWDEVAFIIICLLVTVAVIDILSARIRVRLIGTREGVVRH
ncbi:phosphonate ABC transporter, permease protein PhnE [Falsiroseomonas oryziterrae]|uniref:phosphonate ABC transporter, permease protein PhnE n=1 Tax=Falsiroseomonas oryziterrae TaxID=2911368 RepID=UPI001F031305|nr:phosphonate ABC transporter, permease protein PhnE [Roseomonas sp. NPKOSM-4]